MRSVFADSLAKIVDFLPFRRAPDAAPIAPTNVGSITLDARSDAVNRAEKRPDCQKQIKDEAKPSFRIFVWLDNENTQKEDAERQHK